MRKTRAIRNNARYNEPCGMEEYPTICERTHQPPPIFLENVSTANDRRVYEFAPKAESRFSISVKMPFDDFDSPAISIKAKGVQPRDLKLAIDVVERNEQAFFEAWHSSEAPGREPIAYGPETFGKQEKSDEKE